MFNKNDIEKIFQRDAEKSTPEARAPPNLITA
jgi:hypothetical protein